MAFHLVALTAPRTCLILTMHVASLAQQVGLLHPPHRPARVRLASPALTAFHQEMRAQNALPIHILYLAVSAQRVHTGRFRKRDQLLATVPRHHQHPQQPQRQPHQVLQPTLQHRPARQLKRRRQRRRQRCLLLQRLQTLSAPPFQVRQPRRILLLHRRLHLLQILPQPRYLSAQLLLIRLLIRLLVSLLLRLLVQSRLPQLKGLVGLGHAAALQDNHRVQVKLAQLHPRQLLHPFLLQV